MQLAFLLLAVYTALATASCYFPFNDNRFADQTLFNNQTLLEEVIANSSTGPAGGWMTIIDIGKSPKQPWPHEKGLKKTIIHYCFQTKHDADMLRDRVNVAWMMWQDRIGGPLPENEHCLNGFIEYSNGHNQNPTCYKENSQAWNPDVPEGTLMISSVLASKGGSKATVGYKDKSINDRPDRHHMVLSYKEDGNDPWWLYDTVHEMGHVFGLEHEHQRQDREEYVHYDCTKLHGYDNAKRIFDTDVPPDFPYTIEDACKSNFLAGMIPWDGPTSFSLDMGYDDGHKNEQTKSGNYDHNSIMSYWSKSYAANPEGDVTQVPLVRWRNEKPKDGSKPNAQNAQLIPRPLHISNGDKDGIKHLYPYAG